MTSRKQKASTILAVLAILVLVLIIGFLWTGVQHGMFSNKTPPGASMASIESTANFTMSTEEPPNIRTTEAPPDLRIPPSTTAPDSSKGKKLSTNLFDVGHDSSEYKHDRPPEIVYIKPIKIDSLPLHEHDLLYDSKNGNDDAPLLRHHSGHFRNKLAEIWDPHPQYELEAFGKHFHLMLEHDSHFVLPDLSVTHVYHNMSVIKSSGPGRPDRCFYSGRVRGDDLSTVAVNLCDGMTGSIRTSTGSYFIEPVEHFPSSHTVQTILHAFYRLPKPAEDANKPCDVDSIENESDIYSSKAYPGTDPLHKEYDVKMNQAEEHIAGHSRTKRATNEYFIEVLVAVDKKMKAYHGSDLISYVLTLMSIVARIYRDASIGNSINISVVQIAIFEDDFDKDRERSRNHDGVSAAHMLRKFCTWQRKKSDNRHDTALLLTRENICRNPLQHKCDTLGLAELGTMCQPHSSCSIVQDNGLSAAFTIAHELGHVLNMPHDDDEKCKNYRGDHYAKIMSRMLDHNTYPWSWSACSRHFITEFLEGTEKTCLLDNPVHDMIRENGVGAQSLPGEKFTGNRQCELVFGAGSKMCTNVVSKPVCSRLWCITPEDQRDMRRQGQHPDGPSGCRTQHMPWADGTACYRHKGNPHEKSWCHKGECVSVNRSALIPTNGEWGHWQGWGPCSRTCGGGIKTSIRECDNPAPANGGGYCKGDRAKYRSCATEECSPETSDFREEQCADFNGKTFGLPNLNSSIKWAPKYGVSAPDQCKLYCRVQRNSHYYLLKDKVQDGTRCSPDSFNKCVNGICKKAGCNNELDSDMQIDSCGVCGGDHSTCKIIRGSYNRSEYYYNNVVLIPKGSSNIDIVQRGFNHSNDDHFLVLVDGLTNDSILNGNDQVYKFRKVWVWGGVTLEYSGSNSEIERINSTKTRPIKRDLIVRVLSVGKWEANPPDITFEYTVSNLNSHHMNYVWRSTDWTHCDRPCHGKKYKYSQCIQNNTRNVVSDSHCEEVRKPEDREQDCNTQCFLSWKASSKSDCSSHCGLGERRVFYICVMKSIYESKYDDEREVGAEHCSDLGPPVTTEPCVGPCEDYHWIFGDWESCSVTCGSGLQQRVAVECVDSQRNQVSESFCDSKTKVLMQSCHAGACPGWEMGHLSPCSVTCGDGFRMRSLYCQINHKVTHSSACNNVPQPSAEELRETCTLPACPVGYSTPRVTLNDIINDDDNSIDPYNPINREHMYKWKTGVWSECSKPCGGGVRIRNVTCENGTTGVHPSHSHISLQFCAAFQRPYNRESCNTLECGKWKYGGWGECEPSCLQHRLVVCHDKNNKNVPESECDQSKMYPKTQACKYSDERYQWNTTNWGACSSSCGKGLKKREVFCVNVVDKFAVGKVISNQYCSSCDKPETTQDCRSQCYTWRSSEWSPCKGNCGAEGYQQRNVTCHRVSKSGKVEKRPISRHAASGQYLRRQYTRYDSNRSPHHLERFGRYKRPIYPSDSYARGNSLCNIAERPSDTKRCRVQCDVPMWRSESWGKCSHTCGRKGLKRRSVYCVVIRQNEKRMVSDERCSTLKRPQLEKRCNRRKKCTWKSCVDVQRNRTNDGEYTLLVKSRPANIYCAKMNTVNPLEYITLKAGEVENYSKYESSVPTVSQSRTTFKKVRFNLSTMKVRGDDFTYSQSRGKSNVFGALGDCYNSTLRSSNVRGDFSINFAGTDFRISTDTRWTNRESNPCVRSLNESLKLTGHIGGNCGTCLEPYEGLLLEVT